MGCITSAPKGEVPEIGGEQIQKDVQNSDELPPLPSRPVIALMAFNDPLNTDLNVIYALLEKHRKLNIKVRVCFRTEDARHAEKFRAIQEISEVISDVRVEDFQSLRKAVSGATIVSFGLPYCDNRERVALELVGACRKEGVRQVVFQSVLGTMHSSTDSARMHRKVERALRRASDRSKNKAGLPFFTFNILRCAPTMESFLDLTCSMLQQFAEKQAVVYGALGLGRLATVALSDVTRCLVYIISDPVLANQIYNLTGPAALSGQEYADILSDALGMRIFYKDKNAATVSKLLVRKDWSPHKIKDVLDTHRASRMRSENVRDLELEDAPAEVDLYIDEASTDVQGLLGAHTSIHDWAREHTFLMQQSADKVTILKDEEDSEASDRARELHAVQADELENAKAHQENSQMRQPAARAEEKKAPLQDPAPAEEEEEEELEDEEEAKDKVAAEQIKLRIQEEDKSLEPPASATASVPEIETEATEPEATADAEVSDLLKPLVAVVLGSSASGAATVQALSDKHMNRVRIRCCVPSEKDAQVVKMKKQFPFVEFVSGVDFRKPDTYDAIFTPNAEGVAVTKLMIIPPNNLENRAQLCVQLIERAKLVGQVTHVVLLSVLGAQYESINFAQQARIIERRLEQELKDFNGMRFTILRCGYILDNFLGSKESIKKGILPGTHDEGRFSALCIDDIGVAAAAVLATPGHEDKIYELTGPESLSGAQYAAIFSQVLGYVVKYVNQTPKEMRSILQGWGWPAWQAESLLELFQLYADGQGDFTSLDLAALTGNKVTTFREWITRNKAAFSREAPSEGDSASTATGSPTGPSKSPSNPPSPAAAAAPAKPSPSNAGAPKSKPLVAVATANSATGFATTSELVSQFASQVNVRAVVRSAEGSDDLRALSDENKVDLVIGFDATVPETHQFAFNGAEKALIVPPNFEETRADMAIEMVKGAQQAGVKHIVLISFLGAQYEAILFAQQFRKIEKFIEASGLKYTFLRCSFFMDNYLGSREAIMKNKTLYGAYGDGKFPAVALEDIGRVAATILSSSSTEYENKAFDITGPAAMNGEEYAAVFTKIIGSPIKYEDQDITTFRDSLIAFGWPQWQASGLIEQFQMYRDGHVEFFSTDVKKITGKHVSFEEWLVGYREWFTVQNV